MSSSTAMFASDSWRKLECRLLDDLGAAASVRAPPAWCYDLLLVPTFHAPGWLRLADDADEAYVSLASRQTSTVEELVLLPREQYAGLRAQLAALDPFALHDIGGGRDGLALRCWHRDGARSHTFAVHTPALGTHHNEYTLLDALLTAAATSFAPHSAARDYLQLIRRYMSAIDIPGARDVQ